MNPPYFGPLTGAYFFVHLYKSFVQIVESVKKVLTSYIRIWYNKV